MIKYNWVRIVKKTIYFLIIISIFLLTITYKEEILILYNEYFYPNKKINSVLEKNEYYRDYNFKYVSNTSNFTPTNKNDILNIYYTIINSGMDKFTFYCHEEYENCINDIKDIANSQLTISTINNFVNPYNGFKDIKTQIDTTGKITLNITKNYTDEMIIILNYKVDEIFKKIIKDDMSMEEKIKAIHDYIIENTKYDEDRSDKNIIKYESDNAYGVLIEGYGLCGGYTDAMMLFLEKLGIKNYKIASENHIWNYVYLNNKWYHLDLTWDDPISSEKDILDHKFFLISSKELKNINSLEHIYDKEIYEN